MRKKQVIKGLNNNQKIRIVVDGVGIYMTVGDVSEKFATTVHREATMFALDALASDRANGTDRFGRVGVISGFATRVVIGPKEVDVQVDLL